LLKVSGLYLADRVEIYIRCLVNGEDLAYSVCVENHQIQEEDRRHNKFDLSEETRLHLLLQTRFLAISKPV